MKFLLNSFISLVVKLFTSAFHVMGINGILILIFIVEIPVVMFFADNESDKYKSDNNYSLTGISKPEPLDIKDAVFEENDIKVDVDKNYFLVKVTVRNNYSKELTYLRLNAEPQVDDDYYYGYVDFYDIDYYAGDRQDIWECSSVIPSGADREVPYVLGLDKEQDAGHAFTKLKIKGWDQEESDFITLDISDCFE